jgi:hypothetical protein
MAHIPPYEKPVEDAQPDPEPIAPSLAGPDPGVFHHEPGRAEVQSEETGSERA